MNVIFLDVDGVLNDNFNTKELSPLGYTGIKSTLVKKLAEIVEATNAEIVLTSDWKNEWEKNAEECSPDALYLNEKLEEASLFIMDKTTDKSVGLGYSGRGMGIHRYLNSHPDIEHWVVIDDNCFSDFDEEILTHFVHTDAYDGLTDNDVKKAITIMNGLEKEL